MFDFLQGYQKIKEVMNVVSSSFHCGIVIYMILLFFSFCTEKTALEQTELEKVNKKPTHFAIIMMIMIINLIYITPLKIEFT